MMVVRSRDVHCRGLDLLYGLCVAPGVAGRLAYVPVPENCLSGIQRQAGVDDLRSHMVPEVMPPEVADALKKSGQPEK